MATPRHGRKRRRLDTPVGGPGPRWGPGPRDLAEYRPERLVVVVLVSALAAPVWVGLIRWIAC
jgi:hypothetical protein